MIRRTIHTGLFSIAALALTASVALAQSHTSKPFSGAKVNGGTVTHSMKDGKDVLTLSDDFKVPDTPDPHWQVVDSKGTTYLLQRLGVKNLAGLAKDRVNMSITLPRSRTYGVTKSYCRVVAPLSALSYSLRLTARLSAFISSLATDRCPTSSSTLVSAPGRSTS